MQFWVQENKKKKVKMKEFVVTAEMVEKRTKNIKNWSAPGENEPNGFWLKHLTGLHPLIAKQFKNVLQGGETAQTVEEQKISS